VNLVPLLRSWHDAGGTVLLPRVEAPGRPLSFLRWTPSTVMQTRGFGVDEPPSDAPQQRPDIVLVPLLAVDRGGFRLGYGGGYYDRTLADLGPVTAVGVAFDMQRVDVVPRGPYDVPLTHLATESGIMIFDRKAGA
jgi:5-formyltetrahydrofolate cyclo-ligase